MKIQEYDEFIVRELSIVIGWLSQFWDSLRVSNLLKMRRYTACKQILKPIILTIHHWGFSPESLHE